MEQNDTKQYANEVERKVYKGYGRGKDLHEKLKFNLQELVLVSEQ